MSAPATRSAILVLTLLAIALPVQAGDETAQGFVARLLTAVRNHDPRAVAAMFRYPLRVNHPGLPLPIPLDDAGATVRMYDLLFTPEMRCILEDAVTPITGTTPRRNHRLITAGDVLSIGGGVVVAQRVGATFKITRMTVVGVPQRAKSGVPASKQDVGLRRGGVRQFAGVLSGDAFDRYTVSLPKGTVLQGKLERFRGLDAKFRVTDVNGRPVDAKADGRRVWSGVVPQSGTYRVEIVRNAPFCDPPFSYLLTLSAQ